MIFLMVLTLTGVAGYLNITLTEEIESMSAGLVSCLGIFFSLFFAPMLLKLALLAVLLWFPKANLV